MATASLSARALTRRTGRLPWKLSPLLQPPQAAPRWQRPQPALRTASLPVPPCPFLPSWRPAAAALRAVRAQPQQQHAPPAAQLRRLPRYSRRALLVLALQAAMCRVPTAPQSTPRIGRQGTAACLGTVGAAPGWWAAWRLPCRHHVATLRIAKPRRCRCSRHCRPQRAGGQSQPLQLRRRQKLAPTSFAAWPGLGRCHGV